MKKKKKKGGGGTCFSYPPRGKEKKTQRNLPPFVGIQKKREGDIGVPTLPLGESLKAKKKKNRKEGKGGPPPVYFLRENKRRKGESLLPASQGEKRRGKKKGEKKSAPPFRNYDVRFSHRGRERKGGGRGKRAGRVGVFPRGGEGKRTKKKIAFSGEKKKRGERGRAAPFRPISLTAYGEPQKGGGRRPIFNLHVRSEKRWKVRRARRSTSRCSFCATGTRRKKNERRRRGTTGPVTLRISLVGKGGKRKKNGKKKGGGEKRETRSSSRPPFAVAVEKLDIADFRKKSEKREGKVPGHRYLLLTSLKRGKKKKKKGGKKRKRDRTPSFADTDGRERG